MKPGEMPEFKNPSVRLEKEDWACLHCWTNKAVPYTDVSWASIKFHLKEKCVQQLFYDCLFEPRLLTFWMCRHDVDNPTEDDYYCMRPTLQSDYFLREAATM